jgi:hypothetical protein
MNALLVSPYTQQWAAISATLRFVAGYVGKPILDKILPDVAKSDVKTANLLMSYFHGMCKA